MNFSLRLVMGLMITPLAILTGFLIYFEVATAKEIKLEAIKTTEQVEAGVVVSHLVHELQKERGYSAGFISSKGKTFADKLKQQRTETQAALDAFFAQRVRLKAAKPREFNIANDRLSSLDKERANVSGFKVTVPQMAGYYTKTIEILLDLAHPEPGPHSDNEVVHLLNAIALLNLSKESAGLERAMGATGLGGGFSLSVYERLVSFYAQQNVLLHEVENALLSPGWRDALYATPEHQALQTARDTIYDGFEAASYKGLTAAQWFTLSTGWIDTLNARAVQLENRLVELSHQEAQSATARFNTYLLGGGLIGVLTIAFALIVLELVIRRIKSLVAVMNRFATGDLDVDIKGTTGRNELSLMAKALHTFKIETQSVKRKATELEQERLQLKQQQDFVVSQLRGGLGRLAKGDLTTELSQNFPQEYEGLRQDFNTTSQTLNQTLGQLQDAAQRIFDSASLVRTGSDDLSHRTESQAATLEQTSAALEQLTGSVRDAAEGARNAEARTAAAENEALESGAVVRKAVDAMDAIQQSSGQISQIIAVIEDIAFQTNLLALNAGVEAARAGEAGRGFAVVAEEVRNLAMRSSDAAQQIKDLISESSSHVDTGVTLVNEAGDALKSIVDQVEDISKLVSTIASGAAEQATGLSEISIGVSQLDTVTQQNAAMVHETNQTSHLLSTDATNLEQLVGRFDLNRGDFSGSQLRVA